MKIRFTRQARQDVDALYDYIAQENPDAAQDVLDRIERMVDLLPQNPKLGHAGRVEDTRELLVPGLPYVVVYALTEVTVDIVSIIHTRKRWPPVG